MYSPRANTALANLFVFYDEKCGYTNEGAVRGFNIF